MEKNTLKQYFRSGSRPTQEQFYSLIDACYNENYSVHISGYEMRTATGEDSPIKTLSLEAGRISLAPWFKRINIPESRTYHYALPCSNIGPGFRIQKITMDIQIPESKTYEVKDKNSVVKISQVITLNAITFYNGYEPFLTLSGSEIPTDTLKEFNPNQILEKCKAISVDIEIDYDIKSNIAVSDQFDITDRHADELLHVFGGISIEFKAIGE